MTDDTQNQDTEAGGLDLNEFPEPEDIALAPDTDIELTDLDDERHIGADLEAVFDIPVNITAVLGKTHLEVSELLSLDEGHVVQLDRKVGEAIDIYVNDRLVARGEVVLVDDKLGVTMTEIIKGDR